MNIEANLGTVCDENSTQEEIGEEIFTLVYDAVVDAGGRDSQAGIIAGMLRATLTS